MNLRDTVIHYAAEQRYGTAYTDYPYDHPITRSIREEISPIIDPILERFDVFDPEADTMELQVGMDFDISCTCGFKYRTKSGEQADEMLKMHEDNTGHRRI